MTNHLIKQMEQKRSNNPANSRGSLVEALAHLWGTGPLDLGWGTQKLPSLVLFPYFTPPLEWPTKKGSLFTFMEVDRMVLEDRPLATAPCPLQLSNRVHSNKYVLIPIHI